MATYANQHNMLGLFEYNLAFTMLETVSWYFVNMVALDENNLH